MPEHDVIPAGEIHIAYNWSYADAAARTGATGFIAADVGKFARQLDDNSIWMLTATTPTWVAVSGTAAIADDSITNTKLANMATQTIKGRTTAGTGDPEDLTATQATAILNAVVGDAGAGGTKGLVPAPAAGDAAAGKFLKADGTFAVPSGTGAETGANSDITSMDGVTGAIQYPTQIDFTEGAAPGTPAAGKVSLYAKADGLLYSKDDAGAETALGGGGAGYPGVTTGGTGSLDMAQGTKTANEPFIDASVTWNSSGVAFEGIRVNAINTASDSASTLLKLLLSNSIVFSVDRNGNLSLPNSASFITIAQNGTYRWSSGGRLAWGSNGVKIQDSAGNPATLEFTPTSPSTMGTTENNYDWGTSAYFLRLTANASNTTMTGGRGGPQSGQVHLIVNIAAAGTLTIAHENAGSNASNRFLCSTGADIVLSPNQAADLIYDSTVSRYRVFKRN